jgi:glycosyltransferase involved in cell wall biosynthesis
MPKHILLLSRPAVEGFPPTLNQAAILAERGFRVSVADEALPETWRPDELPATVERHSLGTRCPGTGPLRRFLKPFLFRQNARRLTRRLQPDVVIAYAPDAAHPLGGLPRRLGALLLWHMHELPEALAGWSFTARASRYVLRQARLPDLLTIPDRGRADELARRAGIDPASIGLVQNCPRPVRQVPPPSLRDLLKGRVPEQARIVLYHGAVGPDHGLELAVRSMPQWPKEAVFVMKGRVRHVFQERVELLARSLGLRDRVIFLNPGFQSTPEHYRAVAGADLGWTVLEPNDDNWKYGSPACNKRFECMALGVPQVADRLLGVPEMIEGGGCGVCIPHDSVEAAAAAVNRLLRDDSLRKQMAERGRRLHLEQYNYDRQYEAVLAFIREATTAGLRVPGATIA